MNIFFMHVLVFLNFLLKKVVPSFQYKSVIREKKLIIINDTHREKPCFAQFSTTMAAWLLLTCFICLHNQWSSIHSITRITEHRCLKNLIHQIDSKNEWLLLSASFTAKFGLVFVLPLENAFSQTFHFKSQLE